MTLGLALDLFCLGTGLANLYFWSADGEPLSLVLGALGLWVGLWNPKSKHS